MIHNKRINQFMTPAPNAIEPHQTIAAAQAAMRELGVLHLPVRSGGKVVGIVSERDLLLAAGLKGFDPKHTIVGDVMMSDPYCVAPETPARKVLDEMIERKLGSALIVDETHQLIGIFTVTDALLALRAFVT